MAATRMKCFGWGREGEGMTAAERAFVLGRYHEKFGLDAFESVAVPGIEDLALPAPRVAPPASLSAFCTTERYDRAEHTYGKSYPDYVRGMLGQYDCAPDVVSYPRNEAEIFAVMNWAGGIDASLAPFGGGSSVCGGVEHRRDCPEKMAVTVELRHLRRVLDVDGTSRAARIEAGHLGRRSKRN
jgi:alkyldihydroxyacetonephosphate synthase